MEQRVRVRCWMLALVMLGWCAGCSSQATFNWTTVEQGELLTPGVVIEAADGSFTLVAGKPFVPPRPAGNCPTAPDPHNWNTVRQNTTRVIVRHPAASVPLHGLLSFCSVPPTQQAQGRSHTIKISDSRIPQTSTMASVVWDDVTYPWMHRNDEGGMSETSSWPTWILWLSQQPF